MSRPDIAPSSLSPALEAMSAAEPVEPSDQAAPVSIGEVRLEHWLLWYVDVLVNTFLACLEVLAHISCSCLATCVKFTCRSYFSRSQFALHAYGAHMQPNAAIDPLQASRAEPLDASTSARRPESTGESTALSTLSGWAPSLKPCDQFLSQGERLKDAWPLTMQCQQGCCAVLTCTISQCQGCTCEVYASRGSCVPFLSFPA